MLIGLVRAILRALLELVVALVMAPVLRTMPFAGVSRGG